MPDLFYQSKELILEILMEMLMWRQPPSAVRLDWARCDWSKTNSSLPKFSARNHLGLQLIPLPEKQMLPHSNLPPRPHQTLPLIRISLQLTSEQNLYPPLGRFRVPHPSRVFCERVGILISWCLRSPAPSIKPRREHASVVEYDQIARPQQLRKLAKLTILKRLRTPIHEQQPRPRAIRQRLLRNQLFWKFEMEIRNQHAFRL